MYAKLIIYHAEPDMPEGLSTVQADNQAPWELVANNLTTGKIAELLLCLDELGFTDEVLTIAETT